MKKSNLQINEILSEYLDKLYKYTNRNVIIYYSGWLTNPEDLPDGICDLDMNGFMAMISNLDKNKGLDLILHTPGGSVSATESIITYLYNFFDGDIRAIIPHLAMSGGTMIACSSKEIIMSKHSSLGPIDPQFNNIPAQGILTEFERAKKEIEENPSSIPLWQEIISKYPPTLLNSCQNAIEWSEEILKKYLSQNMFKKNNEKNKIVDNIMNTLGSHQNTKAHDRHLSINKCKEIGLNVSELENDNHFQDLVLTIHHCCTIIFEEEYIYKIFANQNDKLTYRYQ